VCSCTVVHMYARPAFGLRVEGKWFDGGEELGRSLALLLSIPTCKLMDMYVTPRQGSALWFCLASDWSGANDMIHVVSWEKS
jgi:hypothetical protein